jgi:hypothetical protein
MSEIAEEFGGCSATSDLIRKNEPFTCLNVLELSKIDKFYKTTRKRIIVYLFNHRRASAGSCISKIKLCNSASC